MAEKEKKVDPYKQCTVDELINDMYVFPTESRDQFTFISPEAKRNIEVRFVPAAGEAEIVGYVEKWSDDGLLWIRESDSSKTDGPKYCFVPNYMQVKSRIIKLED